jgi:hypothetical protein
MQGVVAEQVTAVQVGDTEGEDDVEAGVGERQVRFGVAYRELDTGVAVERGSDPAPAQVDPVDVESEISEHRGPEAVAAGDVEDPLTLEEVERLNVVATHPFAAVVATRLRRLERAFRCRRECPGVARPCASAPRPLREYAAVGWSRWRGRQAELSPPPPSPSLPA